MSGRRGYARFALSSSAEGQLSVLRDIVVQEISAAEIVAISPEPGVLDEELLIQIPEGEVTVSAAVQVVESRPIVIDGTVRHRLRLRKLDFPDA